MAPTLVDLFCGAGGLSLGFHQAGFQPVFAADWDVHACRTYEKNLGSHVHRLDLSTVTTKQLADQVRDAYGTDIDVVAGGPPCQGFSVQRRGAASDPRNNLAVRFGQMAVALEAKAFVLENVPTILGQRGQAYVGRILGAWEEHGYDVYKAILEAAEYGVPQMRRRAFLVGIRRDLGTTFSFPKPMLRDGQFVTVRQALAGIPSPPADQSEHPDFANHRLVGISQVNLERLAHVPEGGGRLDVPRHMQLPCHQNANGHRHLDVFGRLWWDKPAGTITAMFDNFTRGRFAHPAENRNITGREGARLQSFPDRFVFLGPKKDVARQIGNAVAPLVAQAVAEALFDALRDGRRVRKKSVQGNLAVSQQQIR